MTDLAPGVQVVCIDDSPCTCGAITPEYLTKGRIYTIEKINPVIIAGIQYIGLNLIEIDAPPHTSPEGFTHVTVSGYNSTRFRPVRKTSIESLTAILNSAKTPEHSHDY